MSNIGPLQTNLATEPTLEDIEALLGQFQFTAGALDVTGNFSFTPSGLPAYTSTTNIYGEVLVPYNTETTIITYTVPIGHTFYVIGFRGSGDTDGEFYIKVNGTKVGYSRTTASDPTCAEDYLNAPITALTGDTVTLTCITYESATHTMRANLLGGIV